VMTPRHHMLCARGTHMQRLMSCACRHLAWIMPFTIWACALHQQVAAAGATVAPLHGCIVAASLGTGDAVVFPFNLGRPAVALVARPQELTTAAHRSRRREGTAQQGFRGQLALVPGTLMPSYLTIRLSVSRSQRMHGTIDMPFTSSLWLCAPVHKRRTIVAVCF
jgi:hypothetical protein